MDRHVPGHWRGGHGSERGDYEFEWVVREEEMSEGGADRDRWVWGLWEGKRVSWLPIGGI